MTYAPCQLVKSLCTSHVSPSAASFAIFLSDFTATCHQVQSPMPFSSHTSASTVTNAIFLSCNQTQTPMPFASHMPPYIIVFYAILQSHVTKQHARLMSPSTVFCVILWSYVKGTVLCAIFQLHVTMYIFQPHVTKFRLLGHYLVICHNIRVCTMHHVQSPMPFSIPISLCHISATCNKVKSSLPFSSHKLLSTVSFQSCLQVKSLLPFSSQMLSSTALSAIFLSHVNKTFSYIVFLP